MSATKFTPVLLANTMRCGIYKLTETKIQALIEDNTRLISRTFDVLLYEDAKQWIKDNL